MNKKKITFALALMAVGLGACQQRPATVAWSPGMNDSLSYGKPLTLGARVQPAELMRTEVTVPAYINQFGQVVAIDASQGWQGVSPYRRSQQNGSLEN